MKGKHLCYLLLISLLFLLSCGTPTIQKGDLAPDLLGETVDGEKIHLSEFRGSVVLLIFWTTWCKYCKDDLQEAKALVHDYQNNKFVLFAINTRESAGLVQSFMENYSFDIPALLDPQGKTFSAYGVHGWPTNVLINQQGQVHFTSVGTKIEPLKKEIGLLLGEKR